MLGSRLNEFDCVEFRPFFREDAHIRESMLSDNLPVCPILHEKGDIFSHRSEGDLINVIRVPMRQNHSVHVDNFFYAEW